MPANFEPSKARSGPKNLEQELKGAHFSCVRICGNLIMLYGIVQRKCREICGDAYTRVAMVAFALSHHARCECIVVSITARLNPPNCSEPQLNICLPWRTLATEVKSPELRIAPSVDRGLSIFLSRSLSSREKPSRLLDTEQAPTVPFHRIPYTSTFLLLVAMAST